MENVYYNIKRILIDLTEDGKLPLDMTELDPSVFKPALHPLIDTLNTINNSCQEALDDEWDRSDKGFESMQVLIDQTLNVIL